MTKKTAIAVIVCLLCTGLVYVHRRAIRALIRREPVPPAPKWHFWVKTGESD